MSAAQTLQQSTLRVTISIQAGPDKGSSYQLLPPMALIGRGAENDIVLTDARASRQQAVIRFGDNKVEIEDVSSRQTTSVNGQSGKIQELHHGDIIRMGDTEMVFRMEIPQVVAPPAANLSIVRPVVTNASQDQTSVTIPPTPPPTVVMPTPAAPAAMPTAAAAPQTFAAQPSYQPNPSMVMAPPTDHSGRIRFYIICAVIGAALFYMITTGKNELKDKFTLRSATDVEKDIKTSETHFDEVAKTRFKSPEDKQRFEEAQEHYLAGFRDYEKGQYARALRSFETARAIDPTHELANRYSVLAERKRDEMITSNMVEGRRYKEKRMFSRCSAALDKVLDEISNPDDIRFKESQALKRECDLMLEGKY